MPFQIFYGRKQYVGNFRKFGCNAFVQKPPERRSGKLNSRSELEMLGV